HASGAIAAAPLLFVERTLKDAVGLLVRLPRVLRRRLGGRARRGGIRHGHLRLAIGILGGPARLLGVAARAAARACHHESHDQAPSEGPLLKSHEASTF